MTKVGSIQWHKDQIEKKRAAYSKGAKKAAITKRAKKEEIAKEKGESHAYKSKTKIPKTKMNSRVEYDFLKYIRIVFKWAIDNSGLGRPQIELLLYLFGLGAFSKKQFSLFHKTVGLYQQKTLQKLIDEGWVKLWRPKKGKEYALYTLTHKGKSLCNSMHRYCAGVSEIPTLPSQNKMMREDAPRVNNYFLDMIKKMNKDKAPE